MKPFTIGALCGITIGYLLWAFVKVDLNWTRGIFTMYWTSSDRLGFLYLMFVCGFFGGLFRYVMQDPKP